MLRREVAHLEIDGDECLEEAVVEEQIDEILLFAKGEAVLPADETKAVAEFQNEALHLRDQAVLQVSFRHLPVDAEEFEAVAGLEGFLGLLGERGGQRGGKVMGFALGQGALVGAGLDLVEQNGAAPTEGGGGLEVIEERGRVRDTGQHVGVMSPRDGRNQFSHSL